MPLRWHRYPGRFAFVLLAFALILFLLEHVNGRFWLNDFRVYYDAANAQRAGDPLYGVAHGLSSGYFKYAPVMALLYTPLALLPYTLAASIQYALIIAAFIGSVVIADRLVRDHVTQGRPVSYAPLFLSALVVAVHLHRELHLGNINVLLLGVLLFALQRLLHGREMQAGLLIGLAILAKPHFVVLLPLLALRKRGVGCAAATGAVVIGLLLPAAFLGASASMDLHREWLGEMARHNATLIYTGGNAYNNVDTVYSFLHRAVLQYFIPQPTRMEAMVVLALIALGFGALVWRSSKRLFDKGTPGQLVIEYILLLALVPSITLTDTNHFLFATPLVILLMHHVLLRASERWFLFVAVLAFAAFGGNWGDLWGPFSNTLVHYGVLGAANLLLLALGSFLLIRLGSNQAQLASSNDRHTAHA